MGEGSTIRALVAYESMFGNTERVAQAVAAGLGLEDIEATVIDVSGPSPVDVRRRRPPRRRCPHLCVLPEPAHDPHGGGQPGGRESAAATGMREWIEALPQDSSAPLAAAFDTRVTKVRYLPASASRRAAHLLSKHGCRMVASPAGFLVQDIPGPLESRQVEHAIAWARQVAMAAQNRLAVSSI